MYDLRIITGIDGYQRYHHIVLIVTVEQENAIVDLFKQRHWMFVKAGRATLRTCFHYFKHYAKLSF